MLVILSGCASVNHIQDTTNTVAGSVPNAIGTVAAATIFGGEVSINPDPVQYIIDDINREGRIIHGDARRNTKYLISNSIIKLFKRTK